MTIEAHKTLKAIERKAEKTRRPKEPSTTDPKEELRRLVLEHAATQKTQVSLHHQSTDRKNHVTGEPILCRLGEASKAAMGVTVVALKHEAEKLEAQMKRQLKHIPIYEHFLKDVYGVGPVLAAYLVANIDIHIATKPSNLTRYCGFAVINGRLERPRKPILREDMTTAEREAARLGAKRRYNANIRTKIFTAFTAMQKNAAKISAKNPYGTTSKYLDIWRNVKASEFNKEGVDLAKNTRTGVDGTVHKGLRIYAHKKAWHKAATIFLIDLYVVWRALEGLPVWPTYYERTVGAAHGGASLATLAPTMKTLEEALAAVTSTGPYKGTPAKQLFVPDEAAEEAIAEELDEDDAESAAE